MDFQKTDVPVLNVINKYKYHSGTVMINSKIDPESILSFLTDNMKIFLEKLKIQMFRSIATRRNSNQNIDRE